jgi:hypothetical protein
MDSHRWGGQRLCSGKMLCPPARNACRSSSLNSWSYSLLPSGGEAALGRVSCPTSTDQNSPNSGQQLLWLPVRHADADHAVDALRSLFARHGAPLILKTDNGSPFGADQTQNFLAQSNVKSLFSPAYTPRYNGAVEAGIGSLKTRSERHATLAGRPGLWTHDDVAFAQMEANATSRPRGPDGPTPDELWQARPALQAGERAAFLTTVAMMQRDICDREGTPLPTDSSTAQARSIDREAIRRGLVEHGHFFLEEENTSTYSLL